MVDSVDGQSNKSHLLPPTLYELQGLVAASKAVVVPVLEASRTTVQRRLRRRLSPDVVREIARRYADGEHTPQLCQEYGISKGGLLKLLRTEGVQLRRQPVPERVVTEAARFYEGGMAIASIAKRLDVSREALRRAMLSAGITLRPRGGSHASGAAMRATSQSLQFTT